MGRRREHDETTGTALLDAAERTIADEGVDALSLREVAGDAGTTTRAIYSLFGSKDGLLGALGVRAFDLLKREGDALPATEQPAHDLIEAALVFRRFALEHPALFSIAFHRADPAISPRFRAARLDALAALETRFEPLADANLLGGRSIAEATLQFALVCEGLAWGELRGNIQPPDAERFWRNAVHALITGFAAPTPDHPRRMSRRSGRPMPRGRELQQSTASGFRGNASPEHRRGLPPVAEVKPPSAGLLRLIYGYQVSQAIHVAAALGIADELADGPRAVGDLATATATHAATLHRLLRALAAVEVLREEPDGRFGLSALGEALRGPAGSMAAFIGRPSHWTAWGQLLHSVRTGENAFRAVYGMDVWEYRARHPEEGAIFDAAMTGFSRRVNAAVAAAHDFGRYGVIVDVGGGHGALLAGILARHRDVRGVLFDQPAVVAGARADGFQIVGGSFFESVPAGGDAYLLKSVLHDWEDEPAIEILRACRRAARVGTALLIVERQFALPATKLSDLNMLVGPGGRERTVEEYAALLARAGYELLGETPTAAGVSVFEARAI